MFVFFVSVLMYDYSRIEVCVVLENLYKRTENLALAPEKQRSSETAAVKHASLT